MAAMAGAAAWAGLRRLHIPALVQADAWPWNDIVRWTVRLPGKDATDDVFDAIPDRVDVESIISLLPSDPRLSWTAGGARSLVPPGDIIRILREHVAEELSTGQVQLAGGWVLSQTEWNLLQLAGASRRSAPHAS